MSSSKKYFLTLSFTKFHRFLFAIIFLSFTFSNELYSSSPVGRSGGVDPDDSLKRIINRDARRASLMSAIIPGLGQAVNKKYWKIPIIYAALGGIGYFFYNNNYDYQHYHNELLYRYANNQQPYYASLATYSTDQVNTLKITSKKYRDFCIIGLGMVYLLNIIDANIDAHLKKFDVSDNLSMSIKPKAFYCQQSQYGLAGGIALTLNFK